jgi:iron complex outermembrane receptor protein
MKRTIFSVVLALAIFSANAQNLINGVVTNENNETLSGATIRLKPGNYETISNGDGKFVINNVEKGNYTLLVSYLGYEPHKERITVSERADLKVSLKKSVFQTKEIIVSTTRATEKTPTSHSTISTSEIKRRKAVQDIPYLLQLTPSVVTTSDAGAGVGYTNFRIRGTDLNRINVTINDIPVNDAESHGVWFVNMPDFIESTSSIQIQRGVGTSSNGAAAFGASVNLQTNNVSTDPYAEINNAFGSFNTMKNTVKAGTGLISGLFSFDARLSQIKSDGFIDRASSDLKSFYVSGTYHGEKDIVRFNAFSGHEITYQAWEGIPKVKLEGDIEGMQEFADNNQYSDEERENLLSSDARTYNRYMYDNQVDNYKQDHYQVFYEREINKNLKAKVAYHQTNGFGYYESYRYNEDIEDYNATIIAINNDIDTLATTTDLIDRKFLDNVFYGGIASLQIDLERINGVIGGGWNRYEGDHFGEVLWAQNSLATFAPNHRFYENNGVKDDANIYAKANIKVTENLYTYIDLQYRNINYKIEGKDDDGRDLTQRHTFNFFNPKAGLFYEANDNISTYLNIAIANREPNRSNFVDADPSKPKPKSERLYNIELGGKTKFEKWSIQGNAYLMYYEDQLVLNGNINDVGGPIRENVDKSYRAGIEISGGIKPTNWIEIQANLTFSQNKILNFVSYTDNWDTWGQEIEELGETDISFSPNIIANGLIKVTPIKDFDISFIPTYVGEQFIDNTSNKDRKLDAYFVSNLRLDYSISKGWLKNISIYTQVNNIFNTEYITNAWVYPFYLGNDLKYLDGYYPQAGINFMTGINLRF